MCNHAGYNVSTQMGVTTPDDDPPPFISMSPPCPLTSSLTYIDSNHSDHSNHSNLLGGCGPNIRCVLHPWLPC